MDPETVQALQEGGSPPASGSYRTGCKTNYCIHDSVWHSEVRFCVQVTVTGVGMVWMGEMQM